ncbi:MAG: hypothetical protein WC243_01175 [Patescibacteria group bacterium]
MKKTSAQKIKIAALFVALLIESTALTITLIEYATMGNLTPPIIIFVRIALFMLILLYTHTLTVGAWGDWEQYVIGPVPIAAGIFIGLSTVNPAHARNAAALSLLFLLYFTLRSLALNNLLIRFVPGITLRKATTGILFVFSVVCASVVLVDPHGKHVVSLEKMVTETIVKQAEGFALRDMSPNSVIGPMGTPISLREKLHQDLNDVIKPYRNAIAPIMAVLVFSMMEAVGTVVFVFYMITADGVLWLARKLRIIKVEFIPVQQERPSF